MFYYLGLLIILGVLSELYRDKDLGVISSGLLYFITILPLALMWIVVVFPVSLILKSIYYILEKVKGNT